MRGSGSFPLRGHFFRPNGRAGGCPRDRGQIHAGADSQGIDLNTWLTAARYLTLHGAYDIR